MPNPPLHRAEAVAQRRLALAISPEDRFIRTLALALIQLSKQGTIYERNEAHEDQHTARRRAVSVT